VAEITINAWGKTATVTYPDALEAAGPAAFVALADPDQVGDLTAEEYAVSEVVRFVTDTIRSAKAQEARLAALEAENEVAEQLTDITIEVV